MRPIVYACAALAFSSATAFADVEQGLAALQQGNAELAASKFQKAFDAGDADGAFYIARMLELGIGAEPNVAQARQL